MSSVDALFAGMPSSTKQSGPAKTQQHQHAQQPRTPPAAPQQATAPPSSQQLPAISTSPDGSPALLGAPGSQGQHKYIIQQMLGRGATGTAYLVLRPSDNRTFVSKVVDLEALSVTDRTYALSEAQNLGRCNHFAIVELAESTIDAQGTLLLVMEHGDAGDLRRHVKHRSNIKAPFEEKDIWQIFIQLCLAMDHIHNQKMLHRDVKTANVFLTSTGLVKLGDFGLSASYEETVSADVAGSCVGTPCYLPPELFRGERYGKKADMWSLGVLLYEIAALRRPFEGAQTFEEMKALVLSSGTTQHHQQQQQAAMNGPPPLPPHFSEGLRNVVQSLLCTDPDQRPSASTLLLSDIGREKLSEFMSNVEVTATVPVELKARIKAGVNDFFTRHQSPPSTPSVDGA